MPTFATAPRSIPVVRPLDMSVAICPTLSGPMIVITALSAASTSAKIITPSVLCMYWLRRERPLPMFASCAGCIFGLIRFSLLLQAPPR